jgi:O-antigen/teichoic acid export membrane protein
MTLRRTARNVLSNYALFGVSGLVALILTPLLFHDLHPINYGVLAFALSFAMLLEVLDFGMATALTRFVSRLAAQELYGELRRLASSVFFAFAALGVVMAALVVTLSSLAATFFRIQAAGNASGRLVIALIGLSLLFQMPSAALSGYLQGCHDFHLGNAVDIGVQILRAIAIIVLLEHGYGLMAIAAIFPLLAVLRFIGLSLVVRHASIPFWPHASEFSPASLKSIRAFAVLSFVQDAASSLFMQSDTFLAAKLLALPQLAILVVARRIPWAISRLAHVTMAVAFPLVSSAAAREDRDSVRKFLLISARNTLAFVVPLATALYLWAGVILRIWVGPEVLSGVGVFRAFLVFAVFVSLGEVPQVVLYGTGKIGFSAGAYWGMLAAVVILAPFACFKGGLNGLALLFALVEVTGVLLLLWRALQVAALPIGLWAKGALPPVIVSELPAIGWLLLSFPFLPHSLAGFLFSSAGALGFSFVTYALMVTGAKPQPWRRRVKVLLAGTE